MFLTCFHVRMQLHNWAWRKNLDKGGCCCAKWIREQLWNWSDVVDKHGQVCFEVEALQFHALAFSDTFLVWFLWSGNMLVFTKENKMNRVGKGCTFAHYKSLVSFICTALKHCLSQQECSFRKSINFITPISIPFWAILKNMRLLRQENTYNWYNWKGDFLGNLQASTL